MKISLLGLKITRHVEFDELDETMSFKQSYQFQFVKNMEVTNQISKPKKLWTETICSCPTRQHGVKIQGFCT